jgi:hypothetical protein
MAWERSFEARVLKIRAKELKYQKLNYTIEVCAVVVIFVLNYGLMKSLPCRPYGTLYGKTLVDCNIMVALMRAQEWIANSGHTGFVLAFYDRPSTSPNPSHCVHIGVL